jgi:hypothetical protein
VATPARRPRPGSAKPKRSASARSANVGLGGGLADDILKRQSEKREAGRTQWVKVSDDEDEPTIVRAYDVTPPEQDDDGNPVAGTGLFRVGYIHQVEFEIEVDDRKRKGKRKTITIKRDRWCLDQKEQGEPCPGCADELDRRLKFWLPVIERDAPIVTDSGRVTGYKDRVALLSGGSRLLAVLNRIQKKKGLVNQDVELSKTGENFNVQYAGEALERSPLSADDKKLIKDFDAVKKLDRYTEVKDFDSFYDVPGEEHDEDEATEDPGEKSRKRGSSFGVRTNKSRGRAKPRDDDDEEDDDAPPPRRRRSSASKAGARKPGGLSGLGKRNSKPAAKKPARKPPARSSSSSTTRRRRPR